MRVSIDLELVRRAFVEKSDSELVEIWQRHDPNEWQPEAFEVIRQILTERGVPIPEISQVVGEQTSTERPRSESFIDVWCRWIALIVCIAGVGVFGLGLVTQASRIARALLEDGILPGFAYCLLTGLGVLRSFRPQLPRVLHQASALANALAAIAVVMFWVYLLRGAFNPGTEFVPLLMTLLFGLMIRATGMLDHFQPPAWLGILVLVITAFFFVSQDAARMNAPLATLNQRADLLGMFAIVVALVWAVLLIVGFRRAARTRA